MAATARSGGDAWRELSEYRRDLDAEGLLAPGEEAVLSAAVQRARTAAEALAADGGHLDAATRAALETDVAAGAVARARFVRANLRLVLWVARRYRRSPLALADLVQEGNLGLMRAVETYDHRTGFTFSTYATWWIRQRIGHAIADSGRTIRVPGHLVDALSVLARTSADLLEQLGREPTTAEMAEASGIPLERVEAALRAEPDLVSLSVTALDGGPDLSDRVADPGALAPDEEATRSGTRRSVRATLEHLHSRERDVLVRRFGLDDGVPHTLDELGRELTLTREAVRQIEAKAMSKLRHPCLPRHLRLAGLGDASA